MIRLASSSLLIALRSVLLTAGTAFLLFSTQPLRAQEVTTDRWHAIEEGCPEGGALEVRPVAVLDASSAIEAWKVELRAPQESECSLPQPRRLRLMIDGRAAPTPFAPADGEETAHIVLPDTTAHRLAEAGEVRVVEHAIRADLPDVFRADARRVMTKASSIVRQAEGVQSKQKGTGAQESSDDSPDVSSDDASSGVDRVYRIVDEQPRLVGGRARLQEAIQYPEEAKRKEIEGRVFVPFVVNTEGQAQDLEVVRGVQEFLNTEALRVVREMSFDPGKQRGEPVQTQMILPVLFRPQDGK